MNTRVFLNNRQEGHEKGLGPVRYFFKYSGRGYSSMVCTHFWRRKTLSYYFNDVLMAL